MYLHEIAIFAAIGYLNGYLFRDIGPFKIIALFFILPASLDILIQLNHVKIATIPFLLMAILGFLGPVKTRQRLGKLASDTQYHVGYFMRRRR